MAGGDLTETIRRRYNRFARVYDLMDGMMESKKARAWRERLWSLAEGRILEVGVGTGRNLQYYSPGATVTGIDFSPRMLEKARAKARQLGISADLRLMDAQAMEFPDASFDAVVATCVFCSVPDPVKGLREVRRVCRPGGKILFLEHMRSEMRVVGRLLDIINPVTVWLTGANVNRRTIDNLRAAGIETVSVENLWLDILKLIVARP